MSAAHHPVPVQAPPSSRPTAPVPAAPGPKGPWKWIIGLLVIAGAAFGLYKATSGPAQPATPAVAARTVAVTKGTVERKVRISGQTTANQFANIIAPIMRGADANREMILMDLVKSGIMVKQGQLLAQIDTQSMIDHVDDLADTIESAEADIRKRRAEQMVDLEAIQQTIRVARSQFEKAKLDFSAAEIKTDVERQLLKLTLDEAEASYKQVQSDVEHKETTYKAELRILEITRDRHVRHRDRHLIDIKRFTVHAPMAGLAVMSPVFRSGEMGQIQVGDRLQPGQPFMKIVNPSSMQLEASINQAESSDFRIGQVARIRMDAFSGLELNGRIHSIGALAVGGFRQNYYIRSVPVRIKIEGSDPRLIPDLSASAEIALERAENQTVVPLNAVTRENGKTYAYVKAGEQFEKREIKLGLQGATTAAVLAGLNAGDQIRLN